MNRQLVAIVAIGLGWVGCGDDDGGWEGYPEDLPLTYSVAAPESLLRAIEIIYKADGHSAIERQRAYADLFDPDYVFRFQAGDIESYGMPRAWDLEHETTASDSMFHALEVGNAYSLQLQMQWSPATDIYPPVPGREGWKEVRATNIDCFVMLAAGYGLSVNQQQGRFLAKPANGRWYLAEWTDLPRPFARQMIEPSSWGAMKTNFHPEPLQPFVLPGYAAPESLIATITAIYNDPWQPTSRRKDAYRNLFADEFQFHFQPQDIANGLPESWSWLSEYQSNEKIFRAQDRGDVLSLTLELDCDPAVDLAPPQPGREGWKEIFCRSVRLRLMFNPNDGLEVDGDQARFLLKPGDGRWYLADWTDLPSPQGSRLVGSTTWGNIKYDFMRGIL